MSASHPNHSRLVADIGGTNSRLALYDPIAGDLRALRTYFNRDYIRFEDIVQAWLNALAEPAPNECCLAVAAPPFDDRVTMINIDWSFSLNELAAQYGFTQIRGINDFEGNAYALPHLGEADLTVLHTGNTIGNSRLATVGPGTGLGGATLGWLEGTPVANASEPGHMGLSPATELELELFKYLLPEHGEIYAELLLSGPGLQRIYEALGAVQGQQVLPLTSEQVSARAQEQTCTLCTQSLETFCALLGSTCGDYVLANGAYGGLYLAGGILPRMADFLQRSTFVQRFQQKGKMRAHLVDVPLYIITTGTTGLTGAAHAPISLVSHRA